MSPTDIFAGREVVAPFVESDHRCLPLQLLIFVLGRS